MTNLIELHDYYDWRSALPAGARIGLVPTMGALHAGHQALIEASVAENTHTVVSIFVNPLQFGAGEDLARYPRTLDADKALISRAGADALFLPQAEQMYPEGFSTSITVKGLGERLCGVSRAGHFDGVCTVVCKLLQQVSPDRVYFGEKDYQQLLVIRRMMHDLNIPVQLRPVATVREHDGLALSSRNRYLTEGERAVAPWLYRSLQDCAQAIREGEAVRHACARAKAVLLEKGFAKVDYLALCREQDLITINNPEPNSRLFAAAHLGAARLIDNIEYQYAG